MGAPMGSAMTGKGRAAAPANHRGLNRLVPVVQHKPATRGGAALRIVETQEYQEVGTVESTEAATTVGEQPMSDQAEMVATAETAGTAAR